MAAGLTPRRGAAAVAAVALAGGALALNRFLVGVFYDDGVYAGLALALSGGQGYVHPHLPGTPGAVHYPPLYPLVLAPVFGLLPVDAAATAAKVLNLLLAALGAGLIAWHAQQRRLLGEAAPAWLAPAVVAAAALAIPVLATQSVLFAEPVFVVLLALAVIGADAGRAGPAGVATALALLTRSIGVAAGAGLVLHLLVVRREPLRRAVLAFAPVALAGAGWGLWVVTHQRGIDPALALNYGSYGEILKQAGLASFGVSAPDLPRPLAAITLGWLPAAPLVWLFALPAVGILGYGLALLVRRSSVGLMLPFYLAILAVWPYPPDRFLWAVLPWLGLAWVAGAVAVWRRTRLRIPVAVVAAVVMIGYARYEVRGFAGRWWEGAARAISGNFRELLPDLRALPAEAVLATDDETLVWLYTRRTAVPLYLYDYQGRETVEPSPAEHRAYLERMGVTHVVLASASAEAAREVRALLTAYPEWLTGVHRWSGGRWIFAVNRAERATGK
ncbi:MAG: hypothetical protein HYS40_07265 [Gemmatimonadetes bacterium]|nr:hypothetical protein [Gemmatimonadota bacterium]